MLRWCAPLILVTSFWFANPVSSQDLGLTISPILTIDSDRVYGASLAGQRIGAELEASLQQLVRENRRIEAELETEERSLTEQRATLPADEFRALADAFDQKVQQIRDEQDTKQRELQSLRENDRRAFVDAISPILSAIGNERGALLILERRDVVLSADSIDITSEVIARINAAQEGGTNLSPGGGDDTEPSPQAD
ncbi:MAG: OmpH family outer membrane protein [Marinosulfonomonas sp.]|nr:OmpH family outer membrane protein [Marinosulfonomonas sp.]